MFNPMQSQAALQNKARFPDQKLQQYASGRPPQPTGQVTPPMAGGELAQRGADRQAFQNEAAMQADPSGRPPVLVEKIMQLQQQEQQLGMLAAMLAKKQQDLAAREQGIGALPVRSDMFTAMDGGIVFSGGGAVQRFNGRDTSLINMPKLFKESEDEFYGSPSNRAESNKVDLLRQIELLRPEEQAKLLESGTFGTQPDAYILRRRLQEMGYEVDPKTNRIKQLEEQGRRPITMQERRAIDYIAKEQSATPNEATVRLPLQERSTTPSTPSAPPTEQKPAPSINIPSLSRGAGFDTEFAKLKPLLSQRVDRSGSQRLTDELVTLSDEYRAAVASGRMTEEEAQKAMKDEMDKRSAIQGKFVEGRDARREAIRKATEGDKADLTDYLGAMAAGGPGKTLAETLSKMVPGTQKLREDEKARKRLAYKEFHLAAQADAEADKQFDLGNIEAGNRARKEAEERKIRGAEIESKMVEARGKGILSALNQVVRGEEDESQRIGREVTAGTNVLQTVLNKEAQERIAEYNVRAQAELEKFKLQNREQNPYNRIFDALVSNDPKQRQAALDFLGKGKEQNALPPGLQVELAKQIDRKYENPHDPRVIAAVEKVNPEAAKILRLKPDEAKRQKGYSDALDLVDRLKFQELLTSTGRPLRYTDLPPPK